MIERLAVAASIAIRHAGAYTDLILSDVDTASRLARQRLVAVAIMAGASPSTSQSSCTFANSAWRGL